MNCQALFLYSEKQNNRKTTTGQKFRLTPAIRSPLPVHHFNDPRISLRVSLITAQS